MKFICPECESRTDVKTYQQKEYLCNNCWERNEGIIVPECSVCGDFDVPMAPVDNDLFLCPKCGLYRSGKEKHLTDNNNPSAICPITDSRINKYKTERHHWVYSDDTGPETYIKISAKAHSMIHGELNLLDQCKNSRRMSALGVMLDNLHDIEWGRTRSLDHDHEFSPLTNPGGVWTEHILIRYGYPTDFTVESGCSGFSFPDNVETPEKLQQRRRILKQRREEVGYMKKTGESKPDYLSK